MRGKGRHAMIHAAPAGGTATPTHLKPGHMAGPPEMDHPAGGGDMPLPQGGPGGQPMHMPPMPAVHAPPHPAKVGRPGGRKGGY